MQRSTFKSARFMTDVSGECVPVIYCISVGKCECLCYMCLRVRVIA